MLAIRGDEELDKLFPSHRKSIVGGGLVPHIHNAVHMSQAIDDANLDGLATSALLRLAQGTHLPSQFWVLAFCNLAS